MMALRSGASVDWETIARGMLDLTTEFEIPSSVPITLSLSQIFSQRAGLLGVTLASGITSIPSGAFQNCIKLRSIVIPEGVTTINNYAFQNVPLNDGISLPSTLTTINGPYPFYKAKFTSLTIPANVTAIGTFFCALNTVFEELIMLPTTPPSLGANAFAWGRTPTIYVPDASVSTYQSAAGWSTYASKIVGISTRQTS